MLCQGVNEIGEFSKPKNIFYDRNLEIYGVVVSIYIVFKRF